MFFTCCFPHLPVVNKFLCFLPNQTDWHWLKLIKVDGNWLKMTEHRSKCIEMDWKSARFTRIWRKTIEIAENWLRRFRMEEKKTPNVLCSVSCPLLPRYPQDGAPHKALEHGSLPQAFEARYRCWATLLLGVKFSGSFVAGNCTEKPIFRGANCRRGSEIPHRRRENCRK